MVGFEHHLPSGARKTALALFGLLLGIYLLTSGGHFYAVDEEMMFTVTESLSLHGSLAVNADRVSGPAKYSQYGPGQSIAAVPLYWLGSAIATVLPSSIYPWLIRAIVGWFNPIVTGAVAALLYLAVLLLGFRNRVAIMTTLLYGLGTMAWPQSKTFFAEPLTALLFFGSFILLLAARLGGSRERAWLPFLLAGLLAGLAPAVKIQAGIGLPLLSLFALIQARPHARLDRAAVTPLIAWLAGAALPLGLLGFYQQVAFGSPLATGYGGSVWNQFSAPFWVGFNGQIWSSGRGIIWYAPTLLLFPIGVVLLWRRHWPVAALCALMFVFHVLFYAKWYAWDGAGAWGPRFLNAILPFMALPLAAFLDTTRRPTLRNGALIILALLTIPVQLAGLLISVNIFFGRTRFADLSYYRLADSAIVWHLNIAAEQLRQLYEVNVAPDSVALLSGFSYSEGGDAHVPRWTLQQAEIAVRPPKGQVLQLQIALNSCWAKPGPSPISIASGDTVFVRDATPCPVRTYHFALPPRSTKLTISALPWNPAAFGDQRDETLGILLQQISAQVDGRPLTLRSDTLPVPPMPLNSYDIRHWMADHRMSHWDFWWWYMLHDRLSIGSNLLLAGIWLVAAFGPGGWGLYQLTRNSAQPDTRSVRQSSSPA